MIKLHVEAYATSVDIKMLGRYWVSLYVRETAQSDIGDMMN